MRDIARALSWMLSWFGGACVHSLGACNPHGTPEVNPDPTVLRLV